jgi:hypothetical protein
VKPALVLKTLLPASLAALFACTQQTTLAPQSRLLLSSDLASLKNDGSKATLSAACVDANNKAGTGSVVFTAQFGDVNGTGQPSATAALSADGIATVTYACNVAKEPRCSAAIFAVSASWSSTTGGTQLSNASAAPPVVVADGGVPTDGGVNPGSAGTIPDGSTIAQAAVFPSYIVTSTAANPANGLPGAATITVVAKAKDGTVLSGVDVTFAENVGESLVKLSVQATTTDAKGLASVVATSQTLSGVAHIQAVLGRGQATTVVALPILGPPVTIVETMAVPAVLGLRGSGIQEHGLMTFLVADPLGTPVPQVQVSFAQLQPNLVTFTNASAFTDQNGLVVVDYTSGSEVGVTAITATVVSTGATVQHSVAVRGARASASGFYFRCSKANLPVYTTVSQYETMTCTVRLSDRFGNRVGIPTPVNFATEAGSISASAITKGFDLARPTDPDEGSVTVTFSSDMGNGNTPADVDPLPADSSQFPFPRPGEPFVQAGSIKRNPRDQLVTIIAMTQGEEAFIDSNRNGILDNGEVFIDQGDPFIDANDDGVYNTVRPGGPWEVRFCGSTTGGTCPAYQGPNGKWDAQTTIWKPTWVVFTGSGAASAVPAGGPAPASDFAFPCADFADSVRDGAHSPVISANVFVYDSWLNTPAGHTSYVAYDVQGGTTNPIASVGLFDESESWGSMGQLGLDFQYIAVSAGAQPIACNIANGPACIDKLLFQNWDTGFRGQLLFRNRSTLPVGSAPLTDHGCAPNKTVGVNYTFDWAVQATGPNGNQSVGLFHGIYASR